MDDDAGGATPTWVLARSVTAWARGGRRSDEVEYLAADGSGWVRDPLRALRRHEPPSAEDEQLAERLAAEPRPSRIGAPAWVQVNGRRP